jgi:hypothetical protein
VFSASKGGGQMFRTCRALRQRDERGASAVEFALVLPLLLMILFGIISTGRVYSDHLSATNAVREAARYGAAADVSASTWATDVQERVRQVYFNEAEAEPTDEQICVRLVRAPSPGTTFTEDGGTSCGTAPAAPTGMAPGSCAVLVWMQRPATIQLIAFPNLSTTIGANSVAYYGRTVGTTCTAP